MKRLPARQLTTASSASQSNRRWNIRFAQQNLPQIYTQIDFQASDYGKYFRTSFPSRVSATTNHHPTGAPLANANTQPLSVYIPQPRVPQIWTVTHTSTVAAGIWSSSSALDSSFLRFYHASSLDAKLITRKPSLSLSHCASPSLCRCNLLSHLENLRTTKSIGRPRGELPYFLPNAAWRLIGL